LQFFREITIEKSCGILKKNSGLYSPLFLFSDESTIPQNVPHTKWLDSQVEATFQNLDHATKKGLKVLAKSLKSLVPPARIELAAHGLGIHRSIH
jgi:hypothetical protein